SKPALFPQPARGATGRGFEMVFRKGIMSDLSDSLEALARSRTQLPVRSYFDDDLLGRELELIFQPGPRYVGHELAVPEIGQHQALAHEGDGRALIRTPDGVELISNVCRHRQAVILRGRGRS